MIVVEIPTQYEVHRFGPFSSYQEAQDWCESKGLMGHNPYYNPCFLHVEDVEGLDTDQCIQAIKSTFAGN